MKIDDVYDINRNVLIQCILYWGWTFCRRNYSDITVLSGICCRDNLPIFLWFYMAKIKSHERAVAADTYKNYNSSLEQTIA